MHPELEKCPQFSLSGYNGSECTGVFEKKFEPNKGLDGYLVSVDDVVISVAYYVFNEDKGFGVFRITGDNSDVIMPYGKYSFLDKLSGEPTYFVLGSSKLWKKELYVPKDAINLESKENEIIEGGWVKEPCLVCGDIIGKGGRQFGYTYNSCVWVCEKCYHLYVQPQCLSFIDEKAIAEIWRWGYGENKYEGGVFTTGV